MAYYNSQYKRDLELFKTNARLIKWAVLNEDPFVFSNNIDNWDIFKWFNEDNIEFFIYNITLEIIFDEYLYIFLNDNYNILQEECKLVKISYFWNWNITRRHSLNLLKIIPINFRTSWEILEEKIKEVSYNFFGNKKWLFKELKSIQIDFKEILINISKDANINNWYNWEYIIYWINKYLKFLEYKNFRDKVSKERSEELLINCYFWKKDYVAENIWKSSVIRINYISEKPKIDNASTFLISAILWHSKERNNLDIIKLILEQPRININQISNSNSESNSTALLTAINYSKIDIIDLLINENNININQQGKNWLTAIQLAIYTFKDEIIKKIVKAKKFNINKEFINWVPIISWVIKNKWINLLRILLEANNIDFWLKDKSWKTIMDYVLERWDKIFQIIIENRMNEIYSE